MVLKITNLHILRYLPTYWLYLLERYTIDNQRCTHTASGNKSINPLILIDKDADMSTRLEGTEFPISVFPKKIWRIISEVHGCHSYPTDISQPLF